MIAASQRELDRWQSGYRRGPPFFDFAAGLDPHFRSGADVVLDRSVDLSERKGRRSLYVGPGWLAMILHFLAAAIGFHSPLWLLLPRAPLVGLVNSLERWFRP